MSESFTADDVAAWAATARQGEGILTTVGFLDADELSLPGQINALVALERTRAWIDAQEQRILAAVAEHPARPLSAGGSARVQLDKEWIREDVACALRLSAVTANSRLHTAQQLVHRFATTLDLLQEGTLTMRHAAALIDETSNLDDSVAGAVEKRVLPRAAEQTPAQFRRSVKRAALALDSRTAEVRHEAEVAQRRIIRRPLDHGMAELVAYGPAEDIDTIYLAAEALGDGMSDSRAGGDPALRADQARFDALTQLATHALGGCSGTLDIPEWQGRRPTICVSVAASTLLGLDDQPAELEGYGPISAAQARAIADDSTGTWRRILTDDAGQPLEYDQNTYRPPQRLTDHVHAVAPRCRFRGCRRKAAKCETDHLEEFGRGGLTCAANLIPLCPRHHHAKHDAGWRVDGMPTGTLTWRSPLGHRYEDPPPERVVDTRAVRRGADDPPPF